MITFADRRHPLRVLNHIKIKLTSARGPCRKSARGVQWRKGAFTMALGPQFRRPILLAATLALVAACRRIAGARRPLRGYRQGIEEPDRRHQDQRQYRQHDLSDPSGGEGAVARLPRPQLFRRALRQGRPQAEAAILRSDRLRRRHHFHDSEARRVDRHLALHQAHGLLRGDKVSMRFRRLNMECTRTKTEASIVVTRGKDE